MDSLVYLDHNILNRMVKGEESEIREIFDSRGLVQKWSPVVGQGEAEVKELFSV